MFTGGVAKMSLRYDGGSIGHQGELAVPWCLVKTTVGPDPLITSAQIPETSLQSRRSGLMMDELSNTYNWHNAASR